MDKGRLRPELQNIVDQFVKFRNKYSTMMTHYAAQEEIINLQKMELEKMNLRADTLATTLIDYQRRTNVKLHNLESENQRLQKIMDNSRERDNEYILEVHKNNDEHIRSLEDELATLRSKIDSVSKKHQEQIDLINKRHNEEMIMYKEKLEHCNKIEQRHSEEISRYKKKLDETTCESQKSANHIGKKSTGYMHPAFDDDTANKRKKSTSSVFRWPQLDFDGKKEFASTQQSVPPTKKKKLYHENNEAIVDLEF